ncbi:MAG TPA: Crp/Fnr family transcriptional regulator [Dongiaceae bacterium]|jgi:CRP-like cAMP-binding protein|nr:Crp/Fnr family transcriptional regulator [Dongiaceae bacterium]
MSAADFGLVQPHLTHVDLPLRKRLEARKKPIDYVYFPESGFASVVADGHDGRGIEVGLIGREGMTGLAVVMGTDRTPHETYMQNAGTGWRMTAGNLRRVMEQSRTVQQSFLLYGHAFVIQATYTAMANGRSKIEERLARWLLMAQDRVEGDRLTLTHEFLSLMLGVRRPGVTVALNLLERAGLIQASRGAIVIVDRAGLEQLSNGAYGAPEAEFNRLFG